MNLKVCDFIERVIEDKMIGAETRIKVAVRDEFGNIDWEDGVVDVEEVKENPYANELCFVIEKKN